MPVLPLGGVAVSPAKKVEEALRREAEKSGSSVEELVNESEALGAPLDPRDRAELHLELCEKYLREAEELLSKGGYAQASEKGWGAAARIVKALAAREGEALRSRRELWEFAGELADRLGDPELRHLWRTANVLHQNFYEGWMPPREVELAVEDVKRLVGKLKGLLA
jgi:hypothetical protein